MSYDDATTPQPVQGTVEDTIASMGYVGRVGMAATDVEILNIMIGKTDVTC